MKPLKSYLDEYNKIIKENKNSNIINLKKYDDLEPIVQFLLSTINEKPLINKKAVNTNENSLFIKKLEKIKYNKFFLVEDKINSYIFDLIDEILISINFNGDKQSFNFICSEILMNIYKHSKFKNSVILCQNFKEDGLIDICFFDDGITIPGSFEKINLNFNSDYEAIINAINGQTSDKEKENFHGRGLNTVVSITTLAFEEEILILSRKGICLLNKHNIKMFNENSLSINGTLILIRINNNIIKNINKYINKLIKFNNND